MTDGQKRRKQRITKLSKCTLALLYAVPGKFIIQNDRNNHHPTTKEIILRTGDREYFMVAKIALFNKNKWVVTVGDTAITFRRPDQVVNHIRTLDLIGAL